MEPPLLNSSDFRERCLFYSFSLEVGRRPLEASVVQMVVPIVGLYLFVHRRVLPCTAVLSGCILVSYLPQAYCRGLYKKAKHGYVSEPTRSISSWFLF